MRSRPLPHATCSTCAGVRYRTSRVSQAATTAPNTLAIETLSRASVLQSCNAAARNTTVSRPSSNDVFKNSANAQVFGALPRSAAPVPPQRRPVGRAASIPAARRSSGSPPTGPPWPANSRTSASRGSQKRMSTTVRMRSRRRHTGTVHARCVLRVQCQKHSQRTSITCNHRSPPRI